MSAVANQPYRVRFAGPGDSEQFMQVIALADPANPAPFGQARAVLASRQSPPLTHEDSMALVAETADGTIAGALVGGPPRWIFEHPQLAGQRAVLIALTKRMTMVNGVAVQPEHRGRGVGAALVSAAESLAARAAMGIMLLNHTPDLAGFYRRLGYTTTDRMAYNLPSPVGLLPTVATDPELLAFKCLDLRVRQARVKGAHFPVIGGLLPGTGIAPGTRLAGTRLRR